MKKLAHRRGEDDGWSMVEIVIVLAITAILCAGVAYHFMSGQRAAKGALAIAAARSYSDAVEEFRSDHDGRVPAVADGSSPDWPNAKQGPILRVGAGDSRPYLRSGPPEAVSDGQVALGSPGQSKAWIRYEARPAGSPTEYTFWVYSRNDSAAEPTCAFGDIPASSDVPRCK